MLNKVIFLITMLISSSCYPLEKSDYLLTDKATFKRTNKRNSTKSVVKCKYCNGKGYKKVTVQKGNKFYSHLKLCPFCRGKGYTSINIK